MRQAKFLQAVFPCFMANYVFWRWWHLWRDWGSEEWGNSSLPSTSQVNDSPLRRVGIVGISAWGQQSPPGLRSSTVPDGGQTWLEDVTDACPGCSTARVEGCNEGNETFFTNTLQLSQQTKHSFYEILYFFLNIWHNRHSLIGDISSNNVNILKYFELI